MSALVVSLCGKKTAKYVRKIIQSTNKYDSDQKLQSLVEIIKSRRVLMVVGGILSIRNRPSLKPIVCFTYSFIIYPTSNFSIFINYFSYLLIQQKFCSIFIFHSPKCNFSSCFPQLLVVSQTHVTTNLRTRRK